MPADVDSRASFSTPKPSEGPTLFKRAGLYYVTAGTGCCACIGGASIYVLTSHSLAGPWEYRGDVGSNPHSKFDPASPDNYITRAQGSAVLPPTAIPTIRHSTDCELWAAKEAIEAIFKILCCWT